MDNAEWKKLNKSTKRYLNVTKYLLWIPLVIVIVTCVVIVQMITTK